MKSCRWKRHYPLQLMSTERVTPRQSNRIEIKSDQIKSDQIKNLAHSGAANYFVCDMTTGGEEVKERGGEGAAEKRVRLLLVPLLFSLSSLPPPPQLPLRVCNCNCCSLSRSLSSLSLSSLSLQHSACFCSSNTLSCSSLTSHLEPSEPS